MLKRRSSGMTDDEMRLAIGSIYEAHCSKSTISSIADAAIEDFLAHATKANNGEVPKYYVKDFHPAIIPEEEWGMAQIELERRARLRYSYSSKNCFSSKLVCADCGHLYGPKVWHSTDKYKKTIWQCNYKFDRKGKKQCETPALDEEAVKAMFVKAYNQIRENEGVLANLEKALTEGSPARRASTPTSLG